MIRLTTIALCFCTLSAFPQKIYSTEKEIFEIPEITFYGYDFSDFKLAEEKRTEEDIRIYMTGWIKLMKEKMQEEKLTNWFRKKRSKSILHRRTKPPKQ